ncbi:dihydrofolate reductase family protein [Ahrensia marina]|uniref:dihydrofolate reductase family protein n=1 Tax=Ahrensia marina TaxID=1514904 RepID=UPI0035CF6D51
MQPLVYDVAVSIDGFIAGPVVGGHPDVSRFPHEGSIVDDYQARLSTYAVALMGRATYEFGYAFGLPPGGNPYPSMRSVVISESIDLPADADVSVIRDNAIAAVRTLKAEATGALYLCGGGVLAGSLLAARLIDRLRLKRAPTVLGSGVPLFSGIGDAPMLKLLEEKAHDNGTLFQEFAVEHPNA